MVAGSVISSGTPPAFELQQDGTLYARQANISGNIYANSGQLNNVVINENCQILGKLTAMQIVGDITKVVYFPTSRSIVIEPEPFNRIICTSQIIVHSYSSDVIQESSYEIFGGSTIVGNDALFRVTVAAPYNRSRSDSASWYFRLPAHTKIKLHSSGKGHYPSAINLFIIKE